MSDLNLKLIQDEIDSAARRMAAEIEYNRAKGLDYEKDRYYLKAKEKRDQWQTLLDALATAATSS